MPEGEDRQVSGREYRIQMLETTGFPTQRRAYPANEQVEEKVGRANNKTVALAVVCKVTRRVYTISKRDEVEWYSRS